MAKSTKVTKTDVVLDDINVGLQRAGWLLEEANQHGGKSERDHVIRCALNGAAAEEVRGLIATAGR